MAGVTTARVSSWAYGTKPLRGTSEQDISRAYEDILRRSDDPEVRERWLRALDQAARDFRDSLRPDDEKPDSTG